MSGNGNGSGKAPEMVTLTIDGKSVSVTKGSNIIKAAAAASIDIPYYCYHQDLSVPANCRMCQVKVEGAPKLAVACHAQVTEGMKVSTHHTSPEVKAAQESTLEMILINHPLDCTVCDQAGHCKLQDYHFEYNANPSRFMEEKVHKVKAEELGPHVILDGERCIMCTRCVRFCDEITETHEIGMINRGDRSMITVNPDKPLDNALSGTVVDLCPVGALTHRDWRFNTRIWFTKQTDAICPGCSTGCNVKVAERDGEIVTVKARYNAHVNKEWLCDEGRYGFERFLPKDRLTAPRLHGHETSWDQALAEAQKLTQHLPLVCFASPDLLLEEYWILKQFLEKAVKNYKVVVAYSERELSAVEKILVSPDYAANFRGAEFAGLETGTPGQSYREAISNLKNGQFKSALFVGDRSVLPNDLPDLKNVISKLDQSVALVMDAKSVLASEAKVTFPSRSILEKSGLLVNQKMRLQYTDKVRDFPEGSEPDWRILCRLSERAGAKLAQPQNDRELTLELLRNTPALAGLTIRNIKNGGVCLNTYKPGANSSASEGAAAWS